MSAASIRELEPHRGLRAAQLSRRCSTSATGSSRRGDGALMMVAIAVPACWLRPRRGDGAPRIDAIAEPSFFLASLRPMLERWPINCRP